MPSINSKEACASASSIAPRDFDALHQGLKASFQHEARRLTRGHHDREDLVLSAMLGVSRALRRYVPSGGASIRTYLFHCGVNAMRDEARSQRAYQSRFRPEFLDPIAENGGARGFPAAIGAVSDDGSPNPFEPIDANCPECVHVALEVEKSLSEWLEGLPNNQAIVMDQHVIRGESIKSVATIVGCSVQSLYQCRASLMQKARQEFAL